MQKTKGTVKRFNDAKGYGFISTDTHGDVFVHYSAIKDGGFKTLHEGQEVELEVKVHPTPGVEFRDVQAVSVVRL